MQSLLDSVERSIGEPEIRQMSRQLDASEEEVRTAVAGALPLLVAALADNTRQPAGARSLLGALERDHDGSLLDQLGGYLSSGDTSAGGAILGHVFGNRRAGAERGLGRASGLDPRLIGQVLSMLAPIVLAYLGRRRRMDRPADRPMSPGDLGDILGRERRRIDERAGGRDVLSSILDRDGDGQVADDALEIGRDILGGFLRGRR